MHYFKKKNVFPVLVSNMLWVAGAVAEPVRLIRGTELARGQTAYLDAPNDQAIALVRFPATEYYPFVINGTFTVNGSMINYTGLTASGILFDQAILNVPNYPELSALPTMNVVIGHSGSIKMLYGSGSALSYARSIKSNVSNNGYLYTPNAAVINLSPDNVSNDVRVEGDIVNENSGKMEGLLIFRVFEGDFEGDLVNKGNWISTGSAGVAFQLGGMVGNLINEGTWKNNGVALRLSGTAFDGDFINSGTVTSAGGGIRILGYDEDGSESYSTFNGSIINKTLGELKTTNGHAIEITNASFVGKISNEVGGRILSTGTGKAAIYIGDNAPGSSGSNAGLISGGIENEGLISGDYAIKSEYSGQTQTVNNKALGWLNGKLYGPMNVTNAGLITTGRGTGITGNFVSTGNLELDVDAQVSSAVMTVDGSATLNNSSVILTPVQSLYNDNSKLQGESYQLISATSGVSANNVQLNTSVLIDASLESNLNSLSAKISRVNPEELAVIVDEGRGGQTSQDAIVELMSAFSSNSSTVAGNAFAILASVDKPEEAAKLMRESVVNNAYATSEASIIAQNEVLNQVALRLGVLRGSGDDGLSFGEEAASTGFWTQLLKSDVTQSARVNNDADNLQGFDADVTGLTLGVDKNFNDYAVGGAFTVASVKINKQNSSDYSDISNYQFTLYGSWEKDQWFVDSVLNYGRSFHDRRRFLDGFNAQAIKADFKSDHFGVQVFGGMRYEIAGLNVQPQLGLGHASIFTDAYSETDESQTGFAQSVESQSFQKIEVGIGALISKRFAAFGGVIKPSVRLMGWRDVRSEQIETTSRYLIGGQEFTVSGADPVNNRWHASFNVSYQRDDRFRFIVGYHRNQKTGYHSNNFYGRIRYEF